MIDDSHELCLNTIISLTQGNWIASMKGIGWAIAPIAGWKHTLSKVYGTALFERYGMGLLWEGNMPLLETYLLRVIFGEPKRLCMKGLSNCLAAQCRQNVCFNTVQPSAKISRESAQQAGGWKHMEACKAWKWEPRKLVVTGIGWSIASIAGWTWANRVISVEKGEGIPWKNWDGKTLHESMKNLWWAIVSMTSGASPCYDWPQVICLQYKHMFTRSFLLQILWQNMLRVHACACIGRR